MAQAIKGATEGHDSANLMAHAVWGALAAQLSGGNAAAGAAGAFSGELAARHIAAEMFPDTKPGDLNQDQKQLVSLLGTMAAGIAGGVVGNSTAAATTGAQAGKNAVENNALSKEDQKRQGLRPVDIIDINPLFNGTAKVLDENGNPQKGGGGSKSGRLGVSAEKLPSGYAANSSGNIIGPRGGIYNNTGKTDSAGNAIYSNNGGYYIFTDGGKGGGSSPNPANQIRQNYEQGKSFEDKFYREYSADKSASAREITVKTENGINVRIDIISKDKQGNITCIECKSSSTAPLTSNQKIGFPEIEKSGATITGAGKPEFEGGMLIPPTKIDIIRPDKQTKE